MLKSPLLSPSLFALVMSLSVSAGEAQPTGATQTELPTRAPGLWRITTVSPEIGMQTNDVCITAGDSIIGPRASGCARPSVSRAGDQVIVTVECVAAGRREVESFLFTGDFKSWYRAQSKMSSGAIRSGFTIDAKLLRKSCEP
ncbi:DUF3617 domain-containing protein [Methylocystis iwaonis]|uniref:DUF3617 domain-containing protein n=1 Tax=Methylocystis iwaonis TaxID=2885079 RepID=UPI002E7AC73D|nr:DUF3617 family protein [Methylocystis iwaonis]